MSLEIIFKSEDILSNFVCVSLRLVSRLKMSLTIFSALSIRFDKRDITSALWSLINPRCNIYINL